MSALNRLTLVLNNSFEPIQVTSARRAFTLVLKGAAVVEESSPYFVRTSKITLPVPSVIRLTRYRRVPRQNRSVSRKGILLRDAFTCQYCRKLLPAGELTMDHVTPRSRGGGSTWENLVSSCFSCNNRKGSRTPEEARMILARPPRQVSIHAKHRSLAGEQEAWSRYLFA